jgi:hypothetical protein
MPGRIREIHPSSAVVAVDLPRPSSTRVCPVLQAARLDLAVYSVEVLFGNQKRVVLLPDLLALGDVREIEIGAVLECHSQEPANRRRAWQPEEFCEKLRRLPLVACGDNGVVETDGHSSFSLLRRGQLQGDVVGVSELQDVRRSNVFDRLMIDADFVEMCSRGI